MTAITFHGAGRMAAQVRSEVRRIDVAELLLTILFLVPWLLGALAGAVVTAAEWLWAAAVVGYRAGRPRVREDAPG